METQKPKIIGCFITILLPTAFTVFFYITDSGNTNVYKLLQFLLSFGIPKLVGNSYESWIHLLIAFNFLNILSFHTWKLLFLLVHIIYIMVTLFSTKKSRSFTLSAFSLIMFYDFIICIFGFLTLRHTTMVFSDNS